MTQRWRFERFIRGISTGCRRSGRCEPWSSSAWQGGRHLTVAFHRVAAFCFVLARFDRASEKKWGHR